MQLPHDVHNTVLAILRTNPSTRNDDTVLYAEVLKKIDPSLLTQPFWFTFSNKNLPKLETVGRCRRKCQELYPDLKANEFTTNAREDLELVYKHYAK